MQTRYMERTNSMREKRKLDDDDNQQQQQPERKRPALASVIVEALKMDSLQRLCSSLEPILRRVVSEEVERALAKLGPARLSERSSPKRIEGIGGRNLQLQFRSRLSVPLFTGGKIEGEQGAAIHVVLLDMTTGHVLTVGPEASAKLDVVVLDGDFNTEDDEGWSGEEFEGHLVKERQGKRPLLTGDVQVTLKEGVGTLGELIFTDNSSWIRCRKFRLGVKVSSGYCEGMRVREAKTEAFTVKDHRGELYKKHYPPALDDEVWRLEKIGKDGAFHKKLNKAGIYNVKEFLRLMVKDSQKLRTILGSGMSNRMWETLAEHSKTCVLSEMLYVYYPEDSVGVVFNNIYEFSGLISGKQYYPADSLSDNQKGYVDGLVRKAYENWDQVIEYDSKSLMNFNQVSKTDAIDYSMPVSVPSQPSSSYSDVTVEAYNQSPASSFPGQSQLADTTYMHFGNSSFAPQEQLINSTHESQSMINSNGGVRLALGPATGSQNQQLVHPPPEINSYNDWSNTCNRGVEGFLSEEEIRARSNEMLENDDMQQLLRLFSMNGGDQQTPMNMGEDGFGFHSFGQTTLADYEEDRSNSGKAVVGWLKIKAAMRWGFFIRRKAAQRRAQIVQLDDDDE
ncbi:CALMODULIN-BINDING PROTEIN60 [Arabidopsis thaliana x Arabidopsis arenosa]|uniref:CALMODULIN-BINDING PROTEIN60 n=1 Tax=Arabidopsis thaliana x Arabidopsis arenosa TaxID=1240361 RepID=A0A8T2AZ91_9BRAS|nr:CALMODULIN-BINDING PROTEIN60 [Arabidopsis thaliana x Arabidopsis arenosa]KAG7579650.1 CALMODULIN-BINDING PROTEIN60 [Arabidopsis thaliana x Arabidopsis arenosa]KAG7579651.1 CALMODULIN-BINDING PROTEIN60 [Arabidopsis thaliana x Arabidopsis arenosa]